MRTAIGSRLALLAEAASRSVHLCVRPDLRFDLDGLSYVLPSYEFLGPGSDADPIRLGLFAGVHGDEVEGSLALADFLLRLDRHPDLASGYRIVAYPACNPTGLEDGTRHSRYGHDLNRLFWTGSGEPEVQLLEAELRAWAFHGLIALHTDDTSHGLYGFGGGGVLTRHLLGPALQAAERFLPRNRDRLIDGFVAHEGVIGTCYAGVLSAPPEASPRPFEIVLETPLAGGFEEKQGALVVALETILDEYRRLLAYAVNL